MMTDNSQFSISVSKEQLAGMPPMAFPGHITVIDRPELIPQAIAVLRRESSIVGFDTETRPSFRKGQTHNVALIQVSGAELCFLFRINRTGLTDDLAQWLSDESCTKIGLSLKDDFHMLHRQREFEPAGFIELQTLVRDYHIIDSSLQKIYGIVAGKRISKGQRLSNWEADVLSSSQQAYAALDAWACLDIYKRLTGGSFVPSDSPFVINP